MKNTIGRYKSVKAILRPNDIKYLVQMFGLWVKKTNEWHEKHFKHQTWEKGDMIYMTCRKIREVKDTSDWAKAALGEVFLLLTLRWRWPWVMDDDNDASNWLSYKISLFWYWLGLSKKNDGVRTRLYRPRTNMTRDPFIWFFDACAFRGLWNLIENTSIPFHLYSPTTWALHKYLKTGSIKDLEKYVRLENRGKEPKDDYVKLLKKARRETALLKQFHDYN